MTGTLAKFDHRVEQGTLANLNLCNQIYTGWGRGTLANIITGTCPPLYSPVPYDSIPYDSISYDLVPYHIVPNDSLDQSCLALFPVLNSSEQASS